MIGHNKHDATITQCECRSPTQLRTIPKLYTLDYTIIYHYRMKGQPNNTGCCEHSRGEQVSSVLRI